MTVDRGSSTYASFAGSLLASEQLAKDRLESRGLAVITSSGALVTLMLALATVLANVQSDRLPRSAHASLFVACLLFVVAALFGLAANAPFLYRSVEPKPLLATCLRLWGDDAPQAEMMVTSTIIGLYASVRRANTFKAACLMAGFTVEAGALVPLLLTVVDILHAR